MRCRLAIFFLCRRLFEARRLFGMVVGLWAALCIIGRFYWIVRLFSGGGRVFKTPLAALLK
jgi:flagellar biogenesis protein FliO